MFECPFCEREIEETEMCCGEVNHAREVEGKKMSNKEIQEDWTDCEAFKQQSPRHQNNARLKKQIRNYQESSGATAEQAYWFVTERMYEEYQSLAD